MNDKYDNYSRDDFKYALDNYDYAIAEMQKKLLDKDRRIAELEEENSRLQEQAGYLIFVDGYDENGNPIHEQVFKTYKERCEELEIKLKNAILPKFRVGQEVWFILKDNKGKDVFCGTVLLITLNGYYQPSKLIYTIIQFDKEWRCEEKSLFTTEAEAQKYLDKISK